MLSAFLTPFTSSGINIALPSIGRDLGMDAVLLNWVATGFLLAAVTFLVPFGRLADIRGRKRILQLGILTDTIASFREILEQIAQGKNNAAVAASLVLSERAVEKHINSLFSKLDLTELPDVHRRVKAVLLYLASSQGG